MEIHLVCVSHISGMGEELTTGNVLTDCLVREKLLTLGDMQFSFSKVILKRYLALRLSIDMLDSVNDVLIMIVATLKLYSSTPIQHIHACYHCHHYHCHQFCCLCYHHHPLITWPG